MNELTVFNHEYFGDIRVVNIENEQYFVGNDIAIALGYSKPNNAIRKHVDVEDTLKRGIQDSNNKTQQTTLINESGMYALILGSKLPSAKKFKQWVTSDVLPSIRKQGAYITKDVATQMLSDPKMFMQVLEAFANEKDAHNETKMILSQTQNELVDTKDEINQFLDTTNLIEMETVAKNLGVGKVKLYRWLRDNRILKTGEYHCRGKVYNTEEHNMPFKKYEKYFKIKYRVYNTGRTPILTMTADGQVWLYNLLIDEGIVKRNIEIESLIV